MLVFYCVTGGIIASVYTDLIQGIIMVVAAVLVFMTAIMVVEGGLTGMAETMLADDPESIGPWGTRGMVGCLSWYIVFTIGLAGQPHIITKFMMTRRVDEARAMLPVSVLGYVLSACLWVGIGLCMRTLVLQGIHEPLDVADQAAPQFLQHYANPILAGVVFAGLFSAIMSTADGFLNIGAAAVVHDIPRAVRGRSLKNELLWARIATVLLATLAAVFALYSGDMIAILGAFGWSLLTQAKTGSRHRSGDGPLIVPRWLEMDLDTLFGGGLLDFERTAALLERQNVGNQRLYLNLTERHEPKCLHKSVGARDRTDEIQVSRHGQSHVELFDRLLIESNDGHRPPLTHAVHATRKRLAITTGLDREVHTTTSSLIQNRLPEILSGNVDIQVRAEIHTQGELLRLGTSQDNPARPVGQRRLNREETDGPITRHECRGPGLEAGLANRLDHGGGRFDKNSSIERDTLGERVTMPSGHGQILRKRTVFATAKPNLLLHVAEVIKPSHTGFTVPATDAHITGHAIPHLKVLDGRSHLNDGPRPLVPQNHRITCPAQTKVRHGTFEHLNVRTTNPHTMNANQELIFSRNRTVHLDQLPLIWAGQLQGIHKYLLDKIDRFKRLFTVSSSTDSSKRQRKPQPPETIPRMHNRQECPGPLSVPSPCVRQKT